MDLGRKELISSYKVLISVSFNMSRHIFSKFIIVEILTKYHGFITYELADIASCSLSHGMRKSRV